MAGTAEEAVLIAALSEDEKEVERRLRDLNPSELQGLLEAVQLIEALLYAELRRQRREGSENKS